jgi:hypothetical protein
MQISAFMADQIRNFEPAQIQAFRSILTRAAQRPAQGPAPQWGCNVY